MLNPLKSIYEDENSRIISTVCFAFFYPVIALTIAYIILFIAVLNKSVLVKFRIKNNIVRLDTWGYFKTYFIWLIVVAEVLIVKYLTVICHSVTHL